MKLVRLVLASVLVLGLAASLAPAPASAASGEMTVLAGPSKIRDGVYMVRLQTTASLASATADSAVIDLSKTPFNPIFSGGTPEFPITAMAKLASGTGGAGDTLHVGVEFYDGSQFHVVLDKASETFHLTAAHTATTSIKTVLLAHGVPQKIKVWCLNRKGSANTYVLTLIFGTGV